MTGYAPSLATPAARPAAAVAFERELVALFTDTAELLGIPRSMAAIYAVVFASVEPLSFGDIEERLELSKGSVSQGLRVLRDIGAVREVSAAEDRLERFAPDLEMRKLIQRFLQTRIQAHLNSSQDRLGRLGEASAALPPAERRVLSTRLRKLTGWHRRTLQLLPLVTTFLRIK